MAIIMANMGEMSPSEDKYWSGQALFHFVENKGILAKNISLLKRGAKRPFAISFKLSFYH